jgi:hypothetical protein
MNVYFHIDELNRDAVVASALRRKFARNGHNLVYGNRLTTRLLKYHHDAFDVLVFPRPHFLSDYWGDHWLTWDSKVVMLSTESLGVICKDHHVMARTLLEKEYFEGRRQYVERIDAFCLWGAKQLQAVVDYAEEVSDKCYIVGHPRHDSSCVMNGMGEADERPPGTKAIGIITRAVALNDYFGRSPLDGFTTLFDDHFQYEFLNKETGEGLPSKRPGAKPGDVLLVQAIDVENTLKIIQRLTTEGHRVTVRVHPKEKSGVWKDLLTRCNLRAEVSDGRIPIAHWLKGMDYLIGPPSTSFYDAAMLGVTPISICNLDARRKTSIGELWEETNRLMEHVLKPDSIEKIIQIIDEDAAEMFSTEVKMILREEADFPASGTSLDKVVTICAENVSEGRRRGVSLMWFKVSQFGLNVAWKMKNRVIGREENSATFAMSSEKVRFIDSLTRKG